MQLKIQMKCLFFDSGDKRSYYGAPAPPTERGKLAAMSVVIL